MLRQPKRLALLAYLAVASPRRFHRRDSLLALFWPELDQEHARAALRRALYFLRSELGAEVVAGRGDEEVGVPETELWCDAAALDQALAAGDPASGARALPRHRCSTVSTSPARRRASGLARPRAAPAARPRAPRRPPSLAEPPSARAAWADAAAWARRGLELAPDDEAALRRYLRLLDRTGERLGGAPRLRRVRPPAGPGARARAVDGDARAGDAIGRARARAGRPRRAATRRPRDDRRAAVRRPRRRRASRTSAKGWSTCSPPSSTARATSARSIPRALLRATATPTARCGRRRRVARRFGAGRYLSGTVVEAGGRLRPPPRSTASTAPPSRASRRRPTARPSCSSWWTSWRCELLAAHGVAPGTRLTRIAALTTDSLDALKAYLHGERELRAGRYFDAMEGFQAAVDADPSFALAYYRLAAAAAGCALPDLAREVADRGAEHRGAALAARPAGVRRPARVARTARWTGPRRST